MTPIFKDAVLFPPSFPTNSLTLLLVTEIKEIELGQYLFWFILYKAYFLSLFA